MQNVHFNPPTLTKLEYYSLQLLPFYLKLATTKKLADKGEPITAVEAAIKTAKDLIIKLNTKQNETSNTFDKQP